MKRTEGGKGATTFGSHYIKNIAASGLNQFGVELTQGAISPELDVFADRSVHSARQDTGGVEHHLVAGFPDCPKHDHRHGVRDRR